ncbi:MAG: ubiquinol-cytochrome c reductase iron-sulfur subunit [Chitinophagaceae bacterium]
MWLSAIPAVAVSIPFFSALFGPLLRRQTQQWRSVAQLSDFPVGSTKLVKFENADPLPWAGITATSAAWLRRESENKFIAFSVNCTHLGCPVRWEEKAELFMCPCHGGVYYKDGSVAAGPPQKSLVQYQVRINKNDVQIQTAPVPITNFTA